jgi:glycosyltransferase involved in cell wall biosynthesis
MRILMAARTADPTASGMGLFTFHLATGLAGAGHQVVVLAPVARGGALREKRRGLRIEPVASVPLWPFSSKERLPLLPRRHVERLLDSLRPDVVHVQDHYLVARATLDAARRRGLPVLATNHFLPENVLPYLPVPVALRPTVEQLLWRSVTLTFNRADLVTTPSETGVRRLRAAGLRTAVLAVSCGVDLEVFRPDPLADRAGLRRRLGLEEGAVTVLYVGRLERDKRLDVLLRALAAPSLSPERRAGGGPQLIVVGDGRDASRYRRQAGHLGLGSRVVFTGYVSRRALVRLLNGADIFAMPSEAELLSIATLEAMAVGLPVLAAAAGALPELVQPGVNGHLFRPGDPDDLARQLGRLCDERGAWPRMAEASRAIARRHAIEATVTRYQELYGSLVARRRGPDAAATTTPNG